MRLQGKFAVPLFAVLSFFMLSVLDLDLVQAADPTPEEQLFIYELNRARNNPTQFQTENSITVDLSSVAAQPPLAVNGDLTGSARFKAQEMADNNYFAHLSPVTGLLANFIARINFGYNLASFLPNSANNIESLAAGFDFAKDWTQPLVPLVTLIVDEGIVPPGHRQHLLAILAFWQQFREIGVGFGSNASSTLRNYWAIHTGFEDDDEPFLTGVVYNDGNGNGRFDLNEGLSGVTVSVGGEAPTTTNSAGGWSVKTSSSGSKTVQSNGGSFVGTGTTNVTVGSDNIEIDFISGNSFGIVNFESGSCPSSISSTSQLFSSDGGAGSVSVTTPDGCNWTASSNDPSWITVTSGNSGSGNGTVNYSVSPSSSASSRMGTMTIAGKTFTVTQLGVGASPVPDITANGSGGTVNINKGDQLSIAISLSSDGFSGAIADWWIVVKTPSGEWQYYDFNLGDYTPGLMSSLSGVSLLDFGSFEIFNTSGLGAGTYTYYFAVDVGGQLFFDSVVVTVTAVDPSPQITANGSGGTVNINEGDPLAIAISLSSGSFSGTSADWWIIVSTPSGWQYYDFNLGDYTPGLMPSISGVSLLDFGSNVILSTTSLGAGTYTYYFAIDLGGQLFFKSVVVKITTP